MLDQILRAGEMFIRFSGLECFPKVRLSDALISVLSDFKPINLYVADSIGWSRRLARDDDQLREGIGIASERSRTEIQHSFLPYFVR